MTLPGRWSRRRERSKAGAGRWPSSGGRWLAGYGCGWLAMLFVSEGMAEATSPGGETAGWQRMKAWLDTGLHSYKHTFRRLQGWDAAKCTRSQIVVSTYPNPTAKALVWYKV